MMALNARVWARRILGKDEEYNRQTREQRLLSSIQELGFEVVHWDYTSHEEQPGGKNRTLRITRILLKD
jgi:hypothetical protein